MKTLLLAIPMLFVLVACGPTNSGACALQSGFDACPECLDGETTCTFGDFSATENSCQECQARSALYRELCESGVGATAEEIESDTVCETEPVSE